MQSKPPYPETLYTASWGRKWGHKQCQIHHPMPFLKLSERLRQADILQDFPTSLMSVGKTSDDGMVLVFTKEGVNIFKKEEDVLITCKKGTQSSLTFKITRDGTKYR